MSETSTPEVIAFLSGKGGAGKTSVSLSLALLLTMLEQRVLVIDLDMATHGATYFLLREQQGHLGILEAAIDDHMTPDITQTSYGFAFVASRATFGKTSAWPIDLPDEAARMVSRLLDESVFDYDYVILDCQAGYNAVTEIALPLAHKAVIVAEADSISGAAARVVERQYASALPEQTYTLINKLYLRETQSYHTLRQQLASFQYLPPIPFDFDVREAFGEGRIPLRIDHPVAFLFAMTRIARKLFPTLLDELDEVENIAVRSRERRLEGLLARLEGQRARSQRRFWLTPLAAVMVASSCGVCAALLVYVYVHSGGAARPDAPSVPMLVALFTLPALVASAALVARWAARRGGGRRAPDEFDEEIREIRTLLATDVRDLPLEGELDA